MGSLDVPANTVCSLPAGTIVTGATTVEGSLSGSRDEFQGALTATNAGTIDLVDSSVDGAFSAHDDSGAIALTDDSMSAALTLSGNHGAIRVTGDTVSGPATIDGNTGNVTVGNDTFQNALECSGNDPPPVDSAGSTIGGGASGVTVQGVRAARASGLGDR